ncbi:putative uncharacterized protein FLJ44672 [Pongo pygmaeus]|uniref:putative uncharacterized protein FLJ44672 n=1 Tax=Pongo pygmaeus TaxID=9600 RepID=UPI0023E1956D|nr:putative uncharacterized protein FLJ44672 [Pongo pygmaeus]
MTSLDQAYASQWPFRPSFCLLAASPGPELPQVGLSRPSSSSWLHLQAHLLPHNNVFPLSSCSAPGGLCRRKTSSHQVLQHTLLSPGGLNRASSCVTVASPGSALASRRSSPAKFLPAFQQPRQAQFLPHIVVIGPSSCLTVASPGPAPVPDRLSRPKSSSSWPLQANLLPHTGFFRPSSCLLAASPGPAPASWWPLQAQLLPPIGLTADSSGPISASLRRPPQAKLLSFSSLYTPSSCHSVAFLGQAYESQGRYQAQLLSHGNLPLVRFLPVSQQPGQAQVLSHTGLYTQLMPHGGLSRPSSFPGMSSPGLKLP